jgi:hypothetical protein
VKICCFSSLNFCFLFSNYHNLESWIDVQSDIVTSPQVIYAEVPLAGPVEGRCLHYQLAPNRQTI